MLIFIHKLFRFISFSSQIHISQLMFFLKNINLQREIYGLSSSSWGLKMCTLKGEKFPLSYDLHVNIIWITFNNSGLKSSVLDVGIQWENDRKDNVYIYEWRRHSSFWFDVTIVFSYLMPTNWLYDCFSFWFYFFMVLTKWQNY